MQNTHVSIDEPDDQIYYQCYEKTAEDLAKMNLSFADVIRTWIYLDDIDSVYPTFNEQRDRFYREQGVFDRLVPASTAIGISTHKGHKMFCHVLAVRKLSDQVDIHTVQSPLQCSAMDYKVSFSRALEIKTPQYRRLLISGTASINAEGKTVYIDSIEHQAEQTSKVTDALLESNGMTQQHITRLLSYTKRYQDCPYTAQFVRRWLPDNDGILNVHADICRAELLFEIEAEAFLLKK
jgi:enamine deaminase RidA (YjgF/YER057c/UK114 family)